MDIEILHAMKGDKKKKIETGTKEGRAAAKEFIELKMKKGTVLFLERGKKTYQIVAYNAETDKLLVKVAKDKKVTTRAAKAKVVAVPPIAGGCR